VKFESGNTLAGKRPARRLRANYALGAAVR
jgi:hypothetical protein